MATAQTQDNTPTVTLRALVPDRCNFKDRTFEKFVDRFMRRYMTGIPLGMLDTSSEVARERWEIVEDDPSEFVSRTSEMAYNGDDDRCITHYHADWNGCEETFDNEDDAIDFVRERIEESRYGFPWAWNWSWMPDDRITDDELREAGFTVAQYTGGAGGRNDAEYRLCGIDGGGYSFKGAHFALLCAIVHANRSQYGWTVETDDGNAYITTEGE
jgi:hypothetical protein